MYTFFTLETGGGGNWPGWGYLYSCGKSLKFSTCYNFLLNFMEFEKCFKTNHPAHSQFNSLWRRVHIMKSIQLRWDFNSRRFLTADNADYLLPSDWHVPVILSPQYLRCGVAFNRAVELHSLTCQNAGIERNFLEHWFDCKDKRLRWRLISMLKSFFCS